jgi:hypothetical protein
VRVPEIFKEPVHHLAEVLFVSDAILIGYGEVELPFQFLNRNARELRLKAFNFSLEGCEDF